MIKLLVEVAGKAGTTQCLSPINIHFFFFFLVFGHKSNQYIKGWEVTVQDIFLTVRKGQASLNFPSYQFLLISLNLSLISIESIDN